MLISPHTVSQALLRALCSSSWPGWRFPEDAFVVKPNNGRGQASVALTSVGCRLFGELVPSILDAAPEQLFVTYRGMSRKYHDELNARIAPRSPLDPHEMRSLDFSACSRTTDGLWRINLALECEPWPVRKKSWSPKVLFPDLCKFGMPRVGPVKHAFFLGRFNGKHEWIEWANGQRTWEQKALRVGEAIKRALKDWARRPLVSAGDTLTAILLETRPVGPFSYSIHSICGQDETSYYEQKFGLSA